VGQFCLAIFTAPSRVLLAVALHHSHTINHPSPFIHCEKALEKN
jgi:hypothetical protein